MINTPRFHKQGFTLLELIVVSAIIATLAGFMIFRFGGIQSSGRDTRRQSDLRQYQSALEIYANSHDNLFPESLSATNALNICPALYPANPSSCPDDPHASSKNWHYRYVASPLSYVLWSQLEKPQTAGTVEYFVICSDGQSGKTSITPVNPICPL